MDRFTRGLEINAIYRTTSGLFVVVCQGSVIHSTCDAIVNAANQGCLSGGGVDGAITSAGGEELTKARRALPIIGTKAIRCPTGECKLTISGIGAVDCKLKCRYVLHAVGPNYRMRPAEDIVSDKDGAIIFGGHTLLRSAYRNTMELAHNTSGIKTVCFSLLSAGIFRADKPLNEILGMGLEVVREYNNNSAAAGGDDGTTYSGGVEEVHFAGYLPEEVDALNSECERLFGPALTEKDILASK